MTIVNKQRRQCNRVPHKMHPNSLANLRPFPKGGPAPNPLGRPRKDVSLTSLLKEALEKPAKSAPFPAETLTWRQALVTAWLGRALKEMVSGVGKPGEMFREILERVEGKVKQPFEFNIREEAERMAKEMGLPPESIPGIITEAEGIIRSVGK